MNTTVTLNEPEAKMNAIVSQFGEGACFAHADKVYNQTFRSEPMRICDVLNQHNLTQEQYYTEFNEISNDIWGEIKSELYVKCTGKAMPEVGMDYDDDYCDMAGFELIEWADSRDEWVHAQGLIASRFIKETTEIVVLCNYKGEGEGGFVLFNEESQKLPVFVSKHESFKI